MIRAEIICVGDELMTGLIANTNGRHIAETLTRWGLGVLKITMVGDDRASIESAFGQAFDGADIVIVTGGLGPTPDDITVESAANFFGLTLEFRQEILTKIEERFRFRGTRVPESNRKQAMVPRGAEVLPNPLGTAPALLIGKEGRTFVFLPGVPFEMEAILESLKSRLIDPLNSFESRILLTSGVAESELADRIHDFGDMHPGLRLAYLPHGQGVRLRISAHGCAESVAGLLDRGEAFLKDRLGTVLYGRDEETMQGVVARMLTESKKTLAVAESCTGGLISHKLTNVAGSSSFFERAYVVYSNAAKVSLGVPEETIHRHGAVSCETAAALAEAVRRTSKTDYGLSATGIAGPGGGTREKPAGLVYIGLADGNRTETRQFQFAGSRRSNKERFAVAALNLLRLHLLDASRISL